MAWDCEARSMACSVSQSAVDQQSQHEASQNKSSQNFVNQEANMTKAIDPNVVVAFDELIQKIKRIEFQVQPLFIIKGIARIQRSQC